MLTERAAANVAAEVLDVTFCVETGASWLESKIPGMTGDFVVWRG